MSTDQPELDLDSPDPAVPPAPPRRRTRDVRLPLWGVIVTLVVVIVVTAVVTTVLTRRADTERTRREQSAVLSVRVSVPVNVAISGGGSGEFASYNSTLEVVNAGPLPVDVEAISSSTPGTQIGRLSEFSQAVTVPSGQSRDIVVGISLVCGQWNPGRPLELTVNVVTADGQRHRVSNTFDVRQTSWFDALGVACLK